MAAPILEIVERFGLGRTQGVACSTGKSRSQLNVDVAKGTFVPSIRLGPAQIGWLWPEVIACNRGRVAGLNDLGMRELVRALVSARPKSLSESEVLDLIASLKVEPKFTECPRPKAPPQRPRKARGRD